MVYDHDIGYDNYTDERRKYEDAMLNSRSARSFGHNEVNEKVLEKLKEISEAADKGDVKLQWYLLGKLESIVENDLWEYESY